MLKLSRVGGSKKIQNAYGCLRCHVWVGLKTQILTIAYAVVDSAGKFSSLRKSRTGENFFLHVFQVLLFHHCGGNDTESTEVSPLWRTSQDFMFHL